MASEKEQYDEALRSLDEIGRGIALIKAKAAGLSDKRVGLDQADLVESLELCLAGLRDLKPVFERFRLPSTPGSQRESLSMQVEKILSRA